MSATSSSNASTGTTTVHATEASTASTSSPSTSGPLTLEAVLDTIRAAVQSEVASAMSVLPGAPSYTSTGIAVLGYDPVANVSKTHALVIQKNHIQV